MNRQMKSSGTERKNKVSNDESESVSESQQSQEEVMADETIINGITWREIRAKLYEPDFHKEFVGSLTPDEYEKFM